jgi:DNA-binding NarL/FixJ family response regulator
MARAAQPVSPTLFGRDDLLALGGRRLAAMVAGSGGLLFLAGEAGIGKSRLLGAIEQRAAISQVTVVRGSTYPRDLEVGAAVFLDLGRSLGRVPAVAAAGALLTSLLTAPGAASRGARAGDANRRRRVLTLDVVDALASLASHGPVLVSLEDLHWVDDLSLEILAALARRLANLPMLVVGTYRTDELYPRIPMRTWRARLLNGRLAEEARLGRLSVKDTTAMTRALLGSELPPPRELVAAIHDRADGVPLHVEEIVAAMIGGEAPSAATMGLRAADVPETIDAAILERFGLLSARARAVAEAGAVIGRGFGLDLLAAVVDAQPEELAKPLAELRDRFMLYQSPSAGRLVFKHALICDAVYQHIALPRRRRLHARIADVAAALVEYRLSDAELSQHLEEAGRNREAFETAMPAARAASAISSHAEAYDLYKRARRNMPSDLPLHERARAFESYGAAAAAADDQAVAAATLEEAHRLYLEAGLLVEAAAVLGPLVAARHLLGDDVEARTTRLREGLELLDRAPPGADVDRRRGSLLASLSAAYMLDRQLDESMLHGERARALAAAVGDQGVEIDALATLGSDMVFAGRMDEGWSTLVSATRRARDAELEAAAARAYRMLASCASVLVEYERGETWLREGIEYAERVERWNDRHYLAGHLAHVLWATGRWDQADEVARQALADGRSGITTRATALCVIGYVALGRSDWPHARASLEEARQIGEHMRELQRLSPALWGLAEMAQLRGDHDEAVALTIAGRDVSARVSDAAYLFPFLVTGVRARLAMNDVAAAIAWSHDLAARLRERSIPGTLPAIDHAEGLTAVATGAIGRARRSLAAAYAGWSTRGRCWEGNAAGLDLAMAELRANRAVEAVRLASDSRAVAVTLHSPPLLRRADEVLRAARARHPADEPWAPLTSREWQVARLIASGMTNADIARDLAISPKTVSAHVEHILAKLGAARRTEIATWAAGIHDA